MREELNETEPSKQKCTLLFNVVLTLLVFYPRVFSWLYDPVNAKLKDISAFPWNLPWNSKFCYSEQVFGICIIFTIFFVNPLIIMLIWNRLIVNLFHIRKMTYAEAYTVFLGLMFIAEFCAYRIINNVFFP